METSPLIQRFLRAKTSSTARKTVRNYASVLRRFADTFPTIPEDYDELNAYLGAIRGSDETRDTHYRIIRNFIGWTVAHVRGSAKYRRMMELVEKPRIRAKVPHVLDLDELELLLRHPHPKRERLMLLFIADTGARRSEVANLEFHDLHKDWVRLCGKTGERIVPITPMVSSMVKATREDIPDELADQHVWRGRKGALHSDTISDLMAEAFKRCGFVGARYSTHTLRHTFATLWEGEEGVLQLILGHKTLAMVYRYRQLRLARAKQQHRLFSPLVQLGWT